MKNSITKYNKPSQHPVVRHEQGVKIRDAHSKQIGAMIMKVCAIAGVPADSIPEDTAMFPHATYLYKTLRETLGSWTTDEVVYAFTLAATRKLDADLKLYDRTLNLSYFGDVMDKYRNYKRMNSPVPPQQQADIEIKPPTEQEKEKIMIDGFVLCFEQYTQTGVIFNMGGVNYKVALSNGLLEGQENDLLKSKAQELYISEVENTMHQARSALERRRIKQSIENIDPASKGLERMYMDVCLKKYFDDLIEDKKDSSYLRMLLENEM